MKAIVNKFYFYTKLDVCGEVGFFGVESTVHQRLLMYRVIQLVKKKWKRRKKAPKPKYIRNALIHKKNRFLKFWKKVKYLRKFQNFTFLLLQPLVRRFLFLTKKLVLFLFFFFYQQDLLKRDDLNWLPFYFFFYRKKIIKFMNLDKPFWLYIFKPIYTKWLVSNAFKRWKKIRRFKVYRRMRRIVLKQFKPDLRRNYRWNKKEFFFRIYKRKDELQFFKKAKGPNILFEYFKCYLFKFYFKINKEIYIPTTFSIEHFLLSRLAFLLVEVNLSYSYYFSKLLINSKQVIVNGAIETNVNKICSIGSIISFNNHYMRVTTYNYLYTRLYFFNHWKKYVSYIMGRWPRFLENTGRFRSMDSVAYISQHMLITSIPDGVYFNYNLLYFIIFKSIKWKYKKLRSIRRSVLDYNFHNYHWTNSKSIIRKIKW